MFQLPQKAKPHGGFDKNKPLMGKLGKYRTGKYCLYVKRLADGDVKVLTSLIERAAQGPCLAVARQREGGVCLAVARQREGG